MARAHPPAALELPTAPQAPYDVKKHTYHPKSPPRTPLLPISRAAKGKGKAKAARRPAVNKTFDDDAREDTNVYKRSRSDSHGLSWSPRQTRDSVVDNMLLSLDQLFVPATSVDDGSSNGYSPVTATDPHCASPDLTTTRARGPAHASSEHDSQSDEIESHSTNPPSHRHRSNSSTNYQPALGRIDSVRAMDEGKAVKSLEQSPGNKRMGGPGGRSVATPTSRRKGSKSSGSSSIDFGQMMGGPRWQRAVERRSSSFDHGYNIRTSVLVPGASASISNPNNMKHSQTIPYMNDDAAPTPTVPAGPRGASVPSTAATAFPIQAGGSTAQSLPLRRKDSKRAPAMLFLRHEVGDGADLSGKQGAVKSRPHSRTTSKDALANSIDVDSAVPNSSLLIPKIAETASQSSTSHARERPGFFRRVFGSSRNTVPVVNEMQMPQTYQSSTHSASRAESRTGQNTGSAKYSRVPRNSPVTLGPKDSPQDPPQANLNKKPSFFRWRKKSLSDDTPLPFSPVFLQHQLHHTSTPAVESSPASSLRKVMNPYLSTPATASTLRQHSDSTGTLLGRSKIPVFLPSDDSMSNSHLTTAEADTATFGTSKEDSPLPMSRYNLHASGPSSSEPHSSTEHHVDQVLSTNNDHTIFKDRDKGPGVMERPVDINLVLDRVPFKEDENIASTMSHSRSGSDEELPKLPIKIQPLSHSDFNIPKPKFPAIITKKSSGKDWNSASILLTPTKDDSSPNTSSHRSPRVWLKPTASEEDLRDSAKQPLSNDPIWPSADSTPGISNSASLKLPAPTLEITPQIQYPLDSSHNANDVSCGAQEALELSSVEPTENDRILAKKIFNEDDDATENSGAAAWLGDCGLSRARVRAAYLDLFDWHNLNILAALRSFCGRLLLKGETQQIDRILSAFSTRWCVCNPTHGFKATDVVYTICYSILLLNTDLHVAEIEQKMTRSQFLKNTMLTVRRVAAEAAPHAFEPARASILPLPGGSSTEPSSPSFRPPPLSVKSDLGTFTSTPRPSEQLIARQSDQSEVAGLSTNILTPLNYDGPTDDCGPLVKAPFHGKLSTWEVQVEIVLKNFYNSIRLLRLPLYVSEDVERVSDPIPSSSSLSAFTNSMLRRTPSMLSKAGSESQNTRGRLLESRIMTGRWSSKTRSRPRIYPSSIVPSSRTSFDDDSSMMSPSASSVWSKYSFGKTQTSMSVISFASSFPQGDYQQSIGFANALSQAIIREEASGAYQAEESLRAATVLEDDSLELAGAPWAKEGSLKHKHHLESVDKKAKDRHWNECFAVIEKGWMRLFQFNMNAKSMRLKAKNQKLLGSVVGGGNWTENAEALGKFLLRQTIASALPPPGYSKLRPHVWALSLPTGAVHLFQAGTPDIVKEFVTTANYWSARLSKEPLVGGISNVEYGWSDVVVNLALVSSAEIRPPSNLGTNRPSLQSSIRSSLDQGSTRPRLPGDRIAISDWTPPQQSMMASALMEVEQLKALSVYVKNIEDDLQKHNQLRSAMLLTFSPRHPNHNKAMTNWERKSSYLLREIVKFRTYIDCLQAAQTQKEKIYAERAPATKAHEGCGEGSSANVPLMT